MLKAQTMLGPWPQTSSLAWVVIKTCRREGVFNCLSPTHLQGCSGKLCPCNEICIAARRPSLRRMQSSWLQQRCWR